MQHLPLQVADVDDVEVDDADGPDAGRREVHRDRRSEAAGADAEHLAGLEPALSVHADFRQDEVAAVAPHFVGRQRGQGRRGDIDAAGDRRDDAHRIARLERRLILLQVADVLVVHVHVDEAPELALVREEVFPKPGELGGQAGEQLADGGAVKLDRIKFVGERAERRRDLDSDSHGSTLGWRRRTGHRDICWILELHQTYRTNCENVRTDAEVLDEAGALLKQCARPLVPIRGGLVPGVVVPEAGRPTSVGSWLTAWRDRDRAPFGGRS